MTDWEEFRDNIKKVKGPRQHKITGSWGVYDAYRAVMHNKWYNIGHPITSHEFYTVIRTVNKALIQDFLEGNVIKIPYHIGQLIPIKVQYKHFFKDGRLVVQNPPDWNSTFKLWQEDQDAHDKKIIVKRTDKDVVKIVYCKNRFDRFKNGWLLHFAPNREFKLTIKNKRQEGEIFSYSRKR